MFNMLENCSSYGLYTVHVFLTVIVRMRCNLHLFRPEKTTSQQALNGADGMVR